MHRKKTRRKRGATYDTQLIQKGQHYSVIPRIPSVSSSIPESVKVNMPSVRGEKKDENDKFSKGDGNRQKQLKSEEPPTRD